MLNQYPPGNRKVLEMICSHSFDVHVAEAELRDKNLDQLISGLDGYTTTYLMSAVQNNNSKAVQFLLSHGADPNNYNETEGIFPFSELEFIDEEHEVQERYEIQKLFFQYGADPNLMIEGETEYDSTLYEVFNSPPGSDRVWANLLNFYKLLIIYGGGGAGRYRKPNLKDIDMSRIDEYRVSLYKCDDGYHLGGYLIDGEGKIVGEL